VFQKNRHLVIFGENLKKIMMMEMGMNTMMMEMNTNTTIIGGQGGGCGVLGEVVLLATGEKFHQKWYF
jgi:membrane-bound ClpP family serine protease